eukprot:scaffold48_cov311-Pinguiococcus_pyrenoidosus.AAC.63
MSRRMSRKQTDAAAEVDTPEEATVASLGLRLGMPRLVYRKLSGALRKAHTFQASCRKAHPSWGPPGGAKVV